MASTHKSLRSGTADKRPTTAIADGQIALNTNAASPGLFFKDSTGATIIKVGPVHVGTTAPNATPASGGSAGNSTGEIWLDTSLTPVGVKIWNGASWTNATPIGSTTVQGLLELATDAETQTGVDTARAVTPAGLQSKVSDSISTTSSTTIASSTAVKTAYDLANAALSRGGGTITGNLEIGTTGSLSFEGSTADGFETTIAVVDPTADRTITLPNVSGTVVTTGDTGTVTSTMIADGTIVSGDIASGTIVDANISATAEIAVSKLADGAARQLLQTDAAGSGVEWTSNIDIPGTLDVTSTATFDSIAQYPAGSAGAPTITFTGDTNTGIYSPGADQLAISTNGTGRLFVDASGNVGVGGAPATNLDVFSAGTTIVRSCASAGNQAYLSAAGNAGSPGTSAFDMIQDGTSIAYLYQRANQPLLIGTNNTERLRVTSAGLVGIGTSSPQVLLHGTTSVSSSAEYAGVGFFENSLNNVDTSPTTAFPVLKLTRAGKSGATFRSSASFGIARYQDAGTAARTRLDIALGHGDVPQPDTTVMSLLSSGAVGIGTTSPGSPLTVESSAGNQVKITYPSIASYYLNATSGGALAINKDGTEYSRWDSSGRFLVGTSTARSGFFGAGYTSALQVETASVNNPNGLSIGANTNDDNPANLYLFKTRGTSVGSNTAVQNGDVLGNISFIGANGTDLSNTAAWIRCIVDGVPFSSGDTTDLPGALVFSTTADGASSPTERMRITNDGNILIGTTNTATGARIYCTTANNASSIYTEATSASQTSAVLSIVAARNTTNGSYKAIEYYNSGATATRFQVLDSGNVQNANNSYTAISDVKLKENIVDANSQWDDIKALRVRNYNLKSDQTHRQIGVVAQEVELVSPGLVADIPDYDREGNDLGTVTKSVNYSVLYMKAVKALQEAMERIEQLEADVAALKA